jgi:DNA-binding NtrC family response regulator
VDSAPGLGTRFTIFLPLRVTVEEVETRLAQVPNESRPVHGLGAGTVLLVDDEPLLLDIGSHLLEHLGYQVHTAADGVEALEKMREFRDEITAVILDLSMPRMDGLECLKAMQALAPQLPVLISSGHNVAHLGPALMKSGAKGFLQKPFNFNELARAVKAVHEAMARPGPNPVT